MLHAECLEPVGSDPSIQAGSAIGDRRGRGGPRIRGYLRWRGELVGVRHHVDWDCRARYLYLPLITPVWRFGEWIETPLDSVRHDDLLAGEVRFIALEWLEKAGMLVV